MSNSKKRRRLTRLSKREQTKRYVNFSGEILDIDKINSAMLEFSNYLIRIFSEFEKVVLKYNSKKE